MPANALAAPGTPATHTVTALRTLAFPGPSIKLPPVAAFSLGCRLVVTRIEGPLAVTATGYVPARHLASVDAREADFVAVAERFVGVPYLWGGKTNHGIDCSGLVLWAFAHAGVSLPHSAAMQYDYGTHVSLSAMRPGDLVFYDSPTIGHVGIYVGNGMMIDANHTGGWVGIRPLYANPVGATRI